MEETIEIRPNLKPPYRVVEGPKGLQVQARDGVLAKSAMAQVSVAAKAGHLADFLGDAPEPLGLRALWLKGDAHVLTQELASRLLLCGFNAVIVRESAHLPTCDLQLLVETLFIHSEQAEGGAIYPERVATEMRALEGNMQLYCLQSMKAVDWIEELLLDVPEGVLLGFDAVKDAELHPMWEALRHLPSLACMPLVPLIPLDGDAVAHVPTLGARLAHLPFAGAVIVASSLPDPQTALGRSLWVAGQLLWRRLDATLLAETHATAFD